MATSDEHPGSGIDEARLLGALTLDAALAFGEEARAIARLSTGGLHVFEGHVLPLRGDSTAALRGHVGELLGAGYHVCLRPFFPTARAAEAFARDVRLPTVVRSASEADQAMAAIADAVASTTLRAAFGGSRSIPLRVMRCDPDSLGTATSTDPVDGHPDRIGVRRDDLPSYRVERKSGRVEIEGEGLTRTVVEDVADLVDRCQMRLGIPLSLEWATVAGEPRVITLSAVRPPFHFADVALRRVALVAADEGCVAPLAIDALDRGLARLVAREQGAVACRLYARPYRRLDMAGRLLGSAMGSVPASTSAAAKVAYDAAVAIHADSEHCRAADETIARLRLTELAQLDDEALLMGFDQRHALVADSFHRLDVSREMTRRAVVALELAVGPLPRECYPALSAPKNARERVRAHGELADLARRIGARLEDVDVRAGLEPELLQAWDELRRKLSHLRPLGIDLSAAEIGSSDEDLRVALLNALGRRRVDAIEEARWAAMRRVLGMAQAQPLGAARAGVVSSVGLVLERIVASKGRVAETLAASLGLLRGAAVEAGRRMVDRAVLDAPTDAIYLTQSELVDGLRGEPSGLAARVRARREDDLRWSSFDAPRRLADDRDVRGGAERAGFRKDPS